MEKTIYVADLKELQVVPYTFLMYTDDTQRYAYYKVWNDINKVRLFYLRREGDRQDFFVLRSDAIKAMISYMTSSVKYLKEELKIMKVEE